MHPTHYQTPAPPPARPLKACGSASPPWVHRPFPRPLTPCGLLPRTCPAPQAPRTPSTRTGWRRASRTTLWGMCRCVGNLVSPAPTASALTCTPSSAAPPLAFRTHVCTRAQGLHTRMRMRCARLALPQDAHMHPYHFDREYNSFHALGYGQAPSGSGGRRTVWYSVLYTAGVRGSSTADLGPAARGRLREVRPPCLPWGGREGGTEGRTEEAAGGQPGGGGELWLAALLRRSSCIGVVTP